MSQTFYRQRLHETVLGFKDLEDFMVNFWEAFFLAKGTLVSRLLSPKGLS